MEYPTRYCKFDTNKLIGRDSRHQFTVAIKPQNFRISEPHFTLYNNSDRRKATKFRYVLIRRNGYFCRRNSKQYWDDVSREDYHNLCIFLDSPAEGYADDRITNWKLTLYYWDDVFGFLSEEYPSKYRSKLDAFVSGFYNTKANKQIPGFVPSTRKRPDYDLARKLGASSKEIS